MRLRLVFAAIVLIALLTPAAADADSESVRMNEIQAIGTHNSYKREISKAEQDAYEAAIDTPGDYDEFLAYSHASLPRQLGRQGVRGLER